MEDVFREVRESIRGLEKFDIVGISGGKQALIEAIDTLIDGVSTRKKSLEKCTELLQEIRQVVQKVNTVEDIETITQNCFKIAEWLKKHG